MYDRLLLSLLVLNVLLNLLALRRYGNNLLKMKEQEIKERIYLWESLQAIRWQLSLLPAMEQWWESSGITESTKATYDAIIQEVSEVEKMVIALNKKQSEHQANRTSGLSKETPAGDQSSADSGTVRRDKKV